MMQGLRMKCDGHSRIGAGQIVCIMEIKPGDRIRIIHLKGEDSRYDGREGVVESIDSIGQLHGTWGGLGVLPEEDEFEVM